MSIQRQTAEERCSLLQKLVGFSIPDYKRIAERESGDFRENLGRISRGFSVSTNRIFACRLCPTLQPTTKPLSTIQRKEEESNERDLTDVWSRRYWVYTLPPGRTTLAGHLRSGRANRSASTLWMHALDHSRLYSRVDHKFEHFSGVNTILHIPPNVSVTYSLTIRFRRDAQAATLANDERGRLLLYTMRGWQYHPRMMLIDVDAGNAGSCANRINTPYFDGPISINI